MDTLRSEIMQAHEARSELLKWKLVIVGAIGSVGLGLAGAKTSNHADLVLAAVPLVCIYVDLLCMHLNIRMLVIASWMRKVETENPEQLALRNYERFVDGFRDAFALEDWAIDSATGVLSLAVGLYGVFGAIYGGASAAVSIAFIGSGVIGLLSSVAATVAYRKRRAALRGGE